MKTVFAVMLMLALDACAANAVHCGGALEPINPPVSQPRVPDGRGR